MGRVFFPTYSLNRWGVRETNQQATLGAAVERFPAEPNPRAAQNPTPPILGAIANSIRYPSPPVYWGANPPRALPPRVPVDGPGPAYPVAPMPIVVSSGGGGQVSPTPPPLTPPQAPAPVPVSAQPGPTPTVSVPAPAPTGAVLISSGGGTQTPPTSTIVAASPEPSTDFVSGIATWLGDSTPIFNYNVPNALLAGAVVLGFAFLSSSGKKR